MFLAYCSISSHMCVLAAIIKHCCIIPKAWVSDKIKAFFPEGLVSVWGGGRLERKKYINLMVLIETAFSVMKKMHTLSTCDSQNRKRSVTFSLYLSQFIGLVSG